MSSAVVVLVLFDVMNNIQNSDGSSRTGRRQGWTDDPARRAYLDRRAARVREVGIRTRVVDESEVVMTRLCGAGMSLVALWGLVAVLVNRTDIFGPAAQDTPGAWAFTPVFVTAGFVTGVWAVSAFVRFTERVRIDRIAALDR